LIASTWPFVGTPGRMAQACGIRDVWGAFERSGAVVLNGSPDQPSKHVRFRDLRDRCRRQPREDRAQGEAGGARRRRARGARV